MTLEEFEKSLAQNGEGSKKGDGDDRSDEKRKRRKHHHHHHHHPPKRHHNQEPADEDQRKHKRSRHSEDGGGKQHPESERSRRRRHSKHRESLDTAKDEEDEWVEKGTNTKTAGEADLQLQSSPGGLKRDSWMEAPTALDIDYTQRGVRKPPEPTTSKPLRPDFELKIHENELNKHHLQDLADGKDIEEIEDEPAQHEVDYTFGDSGAQWRMTKLKAVYREADESGRGIDDIALERYGDLRAFDDAREEQTELERRDTYGRGYVGKEKPSGELFQERKMDAGLRRHNERTDNAQEEEELPQGERIETTSLPARTVPLDQTALNRLKAQMMKAKLRGSPDAAKLEDEYNITLSSFANRKEPEVVVLGAMESRMLAGSRRGEVKAVDNRRGRERGLVEENEEMSIEDMVREEKRTKGQAGGEGRRFAERIAKDGKFDVRLPFHDLIVWISDLDYRMTWNTWMRTPTNSPSVSRNPKSISRTWLSTTFRR